MNKQLDRKKGVGGMTGGLLIGGAISLVVLAIVIAAGLIVLTEFNDATTDNTVSNALNDSAVGIAGFVDWYDIIVIMLVVAVIFSLLALGIMAISSVGGGATI